MLKEHTQMINNKITLYTDILGVPMNKLGNWLITATKEVMFCPTFVCLSVCLSLSFCLFVKKFM